MVWALLVAFEATTTSKQPQRSKLSLPLKLVTPIYYMTKFQGSFVSEKMTLSMNQLSFIDLRCTQVKMTIDREMGNEHS